MVPGNEEGNFLRNCFPFRLFLVQSIFCIVTTCLRILNEDRLFLNAKHAKKKNKNNKKNQQTKY